MRQPLTTEQILFLRAEGAAYAAAGAVAFDQTGQSWWVLAALFLLPDLSALGYLITPRLGARLYNMGHCLLIPAGLLGLWAMSGAPVLLLLGALWLVHIGIDRLVGYGMKAPDGFKSSHLSL